MATRFEVVAHGQNPPALRAAAEEALEEVQNLDRLLSLYRPDSEIGRVNAQAHLGPVRVSPMVFRLLEQARDLHRETGGAFDITVAPLLACWGLLRGSGRVPSPAALAEARAKVGMHLVHLDTEGCTVQFARPGVMLDLGAIGKGYAVERAALALREAGIATAFIHGGTSSMQALGNPPGRDGWRVSLEMPGSYLANAEPGSFAVLNPEAGSQPAQRKPAEGVPSFPVATACLRDEALSMSGVWGKCFTESGRTYGHVIDPRIGEPTGSTVMAAVVSPSATDTDALSTALLVLGRAGHTVIAAGRPTARTFSAALEGGQLVCERRGFWGGIAR
jgi:FAD:protein FMN transferase